MLLGRSVASLGLAALLAACHGPALATRLGLRPAPRPAPADPTSSPAGRDGSLLDARAFGGERSTTYVESLDLSEAELAILHRARALRDPATWPRGRRPTCREAAMEAARDAQGSNDPNKLKHPEGVCLDPVRLARLVQRLLKR